MFKQILKVVLVVWLGSALVSFIFMPPLGIYILLLPTVPFIELSTKMSMSADNKHRLEFILEHSEPLTNEQGLKASKRICNLEHLDKYKNDGSAYKDWSMPFCNLEEEDKVYFYKDCGGCDSADINSLTTGYVLVRDEEPIASVPIEEKWIKNPEFDINKIEKNITNGWSKPIIEQLH